MRFRRWVVFTFFIHVLVILLDKGAGLVLFKILEDDPEMKGAVDLLTTLPFVIMAIANMGLATSTVYFLRKQKFGVREVSETNSLVAIVWGGFIAFGAGVLSQTVLPDWTGREYQLEYVIPICLCVPFMLMTSYFNSIQLAIEKIRDYNLVHLISSLTFLPLFFVFFFGVGSKATTSIADARLVSAVLLTGITLWMLRHVARVRPRLHGEFFKAGITYGWKANLTSVLTYLNHRIDLYLLGILFIAAPDPQLAQVAFYSQAVSFAELVWHFPEALRDLFFSKVAGSTHEEAARFSPVLCRLCLWGAAVGGCVIYFILDPVMSLISPLAWTTQWRDTVLDCFLILIPGTVAYTVAKVLQADLAGRGHLNHCLIACSMVLVVMIGLDVVLIPEEGARGAAYASSIAYVASSVYTLIAYRLCGGGTILKCLIVRPADISYAVDLFRAIKEKLLGRKS